jgi:hypothetical protein
MVVILIVVLINLKNLSLHAIKDLRESNKLVLNSCL